MPQRVEESELAHRTRDVLDVAQRGDTVIVEKLGQPEAAILDIVDYHLLRAALAFYVEHDSPDRRHPIGEIQGVTDEEFARTNGIQERFDLIVSRYLEEQISLGRMAELLDLSWFDLRMRLNRLGIPLRLGPRDEQELLDEVRVAMSLARPEK